MTDQIVIHPVTKTWLQSFLARPTHALILNAPAGSGKTTLTLWLVGQAANQPLEKVSNLSYLKTVSPDGKSISIDQIRELSQFLKLKTAGQANLRRFVIIEQAETMTTEAQNSFLKLFEEPPADTLIILNVNNPRALLPTVLSRGQTIAVRQPTKAQLESFFDMPAIDFEKFYNLSGGRVGLLSSMVSGDEQHPLAAAVESAKQLLQVSKFDQLVLADELAKRKDDHLILEALQLIADRSLVQAASRQDAAAIKRWQKVLRSTFETKSSLQQAAQAKLTFTNLMLNL